MGKQIVLILALVLAIGAFDFDAAGAQDKRPNDEVANILQKFKNYRFGAVSIYQVTDVDEIKEYRKSKSTAGDETTEKEGAACVDELSDRIKKFVSDGVDDESNIDDIIQSIILAGDPLPARDLLQCAYDYFVKQAAGASEELVINVYLVTTQPEQIGGTPESIIGMIVSEKPFEEMTAALKGNLELVAPEDIYSYSFMKDELIDEVKFGYRTLYDMVYSYFIQGNVKNKTMEARGIGTDVRFFSERAGNTSSLINGDVISSREVQIFKRISAGQPFNYYDKTNEVLVSADKVSWTRYKSRFLRDRSGRYKKDSLGNYIVDKRRAVNSYLPEFGVELKYGIEEINYPSFWSERMTLSALWKQVKLGVILPTDGWASMSKSVFDQERKLTNGGIGLAGEFDFPFMVIPNSGVFHLAFGVVFGDAQQSSYKHRSLDPDNYITNKKDNDYLIRSNGQLHYTFGVSVDDNYLIRFGVGGTFYTVEKWYNFLDNTGAENKIKYKELASETVGGISGKIEFMATSNATPYGATLQYFDESLRIAAWLRIPVIQNSLSLQLDVNGYMTTFKDTPRPWESSSVFIPMARFIFLF